MNPAAYLHLRLPNLSPPPPLFSPLRSHSLSPPAAISTSSASPGASGRRRRQRRGERPREYYNWRDDVEERLARPRRKTKVAGAWMEELNLDLLARLGPQWWALRVSRAANAGAESADRLARALARHFPDLQFKVYYPAVREKRKLKNGSYSIKSKPLYPGCVFLHCVLNKDLHEFVKECDGIGGFLGSRVGNVKRQINKPKPVPLDQMEALFQQAKEEQEIADKEFEENEKLENGYSLPNSEENLEINVDVRRSLKAAPKSDLSLGSLTPGVSVRVLSGHFKEFTGCLQQVNHKIGKATVGLILFGKESIVDLDIDQIETVKT